MAKATIKPEEVITTPATVTLELSLDEAATLAVIALFIGGSPTDSPLKFMNQISTALDSAGINPYMRDRAGSRADEFRELKSEAVDQESRGAIYFANFR